MRWRGAVVGTLVLSSCGLELVGVGTASTPSIDGQDADPARPNIPEAGPGDPPLVADGEAGVDAAEPRDASLDAPSPADAAPCNGACPAGTARRLCVSGSCVETRRAFVTRAGFTSIFTGVDDADGRCQSAANAEALGGTWRAWFASGSSMPLTRFTKPTVPYRLLDGTQVATPDGLLPSTTSGNEVRITHAIDRDERNTVVTGQLEVWTGIDQYGFGRQTCEGWASTQVNDEANVGLLSARDYRWTNVYLQECNRTDLHLYCFEQ